MKENVINKANIDQKILYINGHLSNLKKYSNEFEVQHNKQSVEEALVQKTVKTTIDILYDEGLIDNYANAEKVLEVFFTTRLGSDLSEQVNDVVQ